MPQIPSLQIAPSAQPCAHVKENVHADEHWHTLLMQEFEAHAAFRLQAAPGTLFVHWRCDPMAVHTCVAHTPFSVQTAPTGFPTHLPLRQVLETHSALVVHGELLGNAAQHTCCWLKVKGTE